MKTRRGSVLLVVLVTVMLLALGAYTFSETMVSERAATAMYGRKVVTRIAADSGVEFVAALLGNSADRYRIDINHNPELFHGILMQPAESVRGRARFSVVAPVVGDDSASSIRFGLIDESGKLNMNRILPPQRRRIRDEEVIDQDQDKTPAEKEAQQAEARQRLLQLPGMTHKIADAILDWLDEDDVPRQYGAEKDYYSNLNRQAKNGPIESLDELLLIRGIDRELLYGEDANRNGLLDPNENDGDRSPPLDNSDGVLQVGLSGFVTVRSRETNFGSDGQPLINVNHSSLEKLREQLEESFNEDVADFILAFRQYGPSSDARPATGEGASTAGNQAGQPSGKENPTEIQSLYDLIGSKVATEEGGVLESPWSGDPANIRDVVAELMSKLTTSNDFFVEGRININQARKEVLIGIPGMTEPIAESIINARLLATSNTTSSTVAATRTTTAWLVAEGIVDLETMRKLDAQITARGDVFRLQVVGYFDEGGPTTRLEAVIDATRHPPQISELRDLSELGPANANVSLVSDETE